MKEPFAPRTRSNAVTAGAVTAGVPEAATRPAVADFSRPKASRVLRNAEFRTIYDQGIRFSGPLFAAFCLARTGAQAYGTGTYGTGTAENIRTTARLGLTVPRAVGNAVVRNRIKRRFREVFRLHRAQLGVQWDIVLNPRKNAGEVAWAEIERAFRKVIEKCGA